MTQITSSSECSKNRKDHLLSQEQRDFYAENGYLVIRGLFDQHTLNALRDRFRAICSNETLALSCSIIKDKNLSCTKSNPEDFVYKIQDILNDPVFKLYSEDPRLLHIASQFLGDQLTALNCMLINKPPHSTRHPSHQDGYYFPMRPLNIVASWTAIDAATVDNGCLYVVPGSHRLELMPHGNFEDSKKFFHAVADEAIVAPKDKRVYLEMGPGDTVFFHPHLVHGSGPNNTKMHRKAMTVHYMASSCRYIDRYCLEKIKNSTVNMYYCGVTNYITRFVERNSDFTKNKCVTEFYNFTMGKTTFEGVIPSCIFPERRDIKPEIKKLAALNTYLVFKEV